jgi:hypothetical protein
MTPEEHRALGVELYNQTWELLEGGAAPDVVVDTAHASAHHWRDAAGATPANAARSQWLCSHVYAVLGRGEPALFHAERCLALVDGAPDEMEEFDLPAAYEALARAHAAAGTVEDARRYLELGRTETAKIADTEDREHMESQLDSVVT